MSDALANALSGEAPTIARSAPAVVNPLAGIGAAQQLIQGTQGLDKTYAQQQFGRALQQATDANGNVDYPTAIKIASQDPRTAYAMQQGLLDAASLRTSQLNNAAGTQRLIAGHAIMVARDPKDATVNAAFDDLAAHGAPAPEVARERARWLAMTEVQRQQEAVRVGMTNLELLHGAVGQTGTVNRGGEIVPTQVTPGLPGYGGPQLTQGRGGITTTASPDAVYSSGMVDVQATDADVKAGRASVIGETIHIPRADAEKRGGYGGALPPVYQQGGGAPGGARPPAVVRNADGSEVTPANPARGRQLNVPGSKPAVPAAPATAAPAPTAPAPAAPAAPAPAPAPAVAPAPAAAASPAPPAPAAAPASPPWARPGVTDISPLAGGGVQVASNALAAPALGPVVSDASIPGPFTGSGLQGTVAPAGASWTSGPGIDEQEEAKLSRERLTASRNAAANYATEAFPGMEALNLYGRGITTAYGSDWLQQRKSFVAGVWRSMNGDPGRLGKEVSERDALGKWLVNESLNNPVATKSDAMLAQTLAGSANTHIHELASEDMIKAGMAMRRMKAAVSSEWDSNPDVRRQYGYFTRYERDFAKTIDPRAFAFDLYNPEQLKTLKADLRREGEKSAQRFEDALGIAERNGFLTGKRAMP